MSEYKLCLRNDADGHLFELNLQLLELKSQLTASGKKL